MEGNLAGGDAVVWFVVMTGLVFGMLAFGTYLAVHSYDRARGVVHFHLPHWRH
jgi:hypothetical protein